MFEIMKNLETTVEDTLTRTMILENQANDENAIDENGNLIPAGVCKNQLGLGCQKKMQQY